MSEPGLTSGIQDRPKHDFPAAFGRVHHALSLNFFIYKMAWMCVQVPCYSPDTPWIYFLYLMC